MIARRWLLALLLLALAPFVHGQISLPKQLTGGVKPEAAVATAAAPAADEVRAQAEAQLAEARRKQEEGLLESGASPQADGVPASDRQRLLGRLVVAYSDRLQVLDELEKLKQSQSESSTQPALTADFAGPPPYSALRVDLLRDQQDAASERLQALTLAERALEAQKATLLDVQRRASEAVRLADDKLARGKGEPERLNRELAAMRVQLAGTELTTIDLGLEKVRLEMSGLRMINDELQRLLARVLPEQRLSKEDFEQQQALLQNSLARVSAEIDRLVADNTRRTVERERLAKLAKSAKLASPGGSSADQARRLQLLDDRLETDRISMMTMTWLQTLLQAAGDAWAQRYVAFHSEDPKTRQTVISALSRTRMELESRKQLVHELQKAGRVLVRQQELRVDAASLDTDLAAHEAAVLEALKQRLQGLQRVDVASTRLERQLQRWLDDFGFEGKTASSENWQLGALQLGQTLKRVWDFEMFAVEEATVVDGKTVTVTYGVTVGKSIGALLLFIVGYGLFSLLSRRLQRIMVSRFGVNEQMASVIRRWAMISLAVVLIIFILNLARIPLTVFAFLGGALAIGIGFGTQTIIKNVISGIIILFERKIRVGDIIALGGMTGHVTAVDLRASTVRGFDGVEALVPNSSFLENQVVNWTYSNPRIRREVRIGVAYGAPVHQAAEIIAGCANDHGQILKDPPPEVFFEDFGDSALLMVLVFWVELGPNLVSRRVDSDLRYAMEKRLATAGIPIPFPQRDLHFDPSRPLAVRLTRAQDAAG